MCSLLDRLYFSLLLEVSSELYITVSVILIVVSPASNKLLLTLGSCVQNSIGVASPTSELITFSSLNGRNVNLCTINIGDTISHNILIIIQGTIFTSTESNVCSFRLVSCKRCKRYAHDNHERGRQQSKQTSFKSRFLHVISPIL